MLFLLRNVECSVDTRDADFHAAEQWSGDDILGQRATFRADRHPAALILTNVKLRDEGVYRCRVDFRLAQTRNAHVNLTVIGKTIPFFFYSIHKHLFGHRVTRANKVERPGALLFYISMQLAFISSHQNMGRYI